MIRKTAAITAASIAGVILAGGAAVGTNIGILNAADNNSLGELSAEAFIVTPTAEPTGEATLAPITDGVVPADSKQSFTVDVAGSVEVESRAGDLQLGEVRTSQGWAWENTSTSSGSIKLTFTSVDDTLEFEATLADDGTIDGGVDRPSVASGNSGGSVAAVPTQRRATVTSGAAVSSPTAAASAAASSAPAASIPARSFGDDSFDDDSFDDSDFDDDSFDDSDFDDGEFDDGELDDSDFDDDSFDDDSDDSDFDDDSSGHEGRDDDD